MWNANLFDYGWRGTEGPLPFRLGTVRQRDEFIPKMQLWFRSAQSTRVTDLGSVPQIEKQPVLAAVVALVAALDVCLWPEASVRCLTAIRRRKVGGEADMPRQPNRPG